MRAYAWALLGLGVLLFIVAIPGALADAPVWSTPTAAETIAYSQVGQATSYIASSNCVGGSFQTNKIFLAPGTYLIVYTWASNSSITADGIAITFLDNANSTNVNVRLLGDGTLVNSVPAISTVSGLKYEPVSMTNFTGSVPKFMRNAVRITIVSGWQNVVVQSNTGSRFGSMPPQSGTIGKVGFQSCASGQEDVIRYVTNFPVAPGTPTVVPSPVVDGSGGCIFVNWTAAAGATGYNVYTSTSTHAAVSPMNSSAYAYKGTVGGLNTTVCGLPSQTTHFVRVVGETSGSEGPASAEGSGSTPTGPPGTPTITPSGNNLTVNWTAGSGATGYDVWLKNTSVPPAPTRAIPMNGTTWTYAGHVGGLSTTISNVDIHATYCFAIEGTHATTGEGDVGASNCGSVDTPRPLPPFLTGTYVPCGVFALNWTLPNGTITSYALNRTGTLPVNWSYVVPPNGNFTLRVWNDTFPQISGTLSYTAQAVGPGGYSLLSNVVNFTPPAVTTVGECGLAFGGMNATQFAEVSGLSGATVDAIPLMFSIILIIAGAAIGAVAMRGAGAAIGAAAGVLLSIAFGYIPLWAIFLAAIVAAGGFFLSRGVAQGSRSLGGRFR